MNDQAESTQVVPIPTLIRAMLEKGLHPSEIRKRLATAGIVWSYQWRRTEPGKRERARHLKAVGLKACTQCGHGYDCTQTSDLCADCLQQKWAGSQ